MISTMNEDGVITRDPEQVKQRALEMSRTGYGYLSVCSFISREHLGHDRHPFHLDDDQTEDALRAIMSADDNEDEFIAPGH